MRHLAVALLATAVLVAGLSFAVRSVLDHAVAAVQIGGHR